MKLTVKIKLLPTKEQKISLVRTIEIFNEACNYISMIAFKEKKFGQVGLHHLVYAVVRERYGLSAQLTVRAIGKVAESYRADKKCLHIFKKHSAVVYDNRILSFKNLDTVSILSIDGNLFLCLCIELPDGTPIDPSGILGVDFGIINLVTTSDGEKFSGQQVDNVRKCMTRLKKSLQKRGSKSAKRHLKKLSGRERRFKRHTNHTISKRIVQIAKDTQQAIAIENLNGFRVTVQKTQKERFGKWAFDELRQFIEYKAKLSGIPLITVDPRNTSRTCSQCGHIAKSNRKSQSKFVCGQCGFSLNADVNAAINIALRASVSTPIAVHAPIVAVAPSLGTAMPRQLAAG